MIGYGRMICMTCREGSTGVCRRTSSNLRKHNMCFGMHDSQVIDLPVTLSSPKTVRP